MAQEKVKVYCKDCEYFKGYTVLECKNPVFVTILDTPVTQQTCYGDFWELNKDNACCGFKLKQVVEKKHGFGLWR